MGGWRGVPSAVAQSAFWWEAVDGSRVRAEYLYESYGKEKYDIGPFNDTLKWDQHIVRAAAIWVW